jgi:branched-chain amino acid transport system ATP-binding protein
MLTVRNLQAGVNGCAVLHGVSLMVEDQSITAILGENGAGKTTLANSICGFLPVSAGQVIFEGVDITQRPPCERLMRGIACVPAEPRLFPEMSVLENLELGSADCTNVPASGQIEFVLSLFPKLQPSLNASARLLPLGLQRLLMVARALMSAPRLLVLDQPSFGLSGEQTQTLQRAISQLNSRHAITILLLEQNLFQAVKLADTVYCMSHGRVTARHSGLELLADRELQTEFLRGALQPGTEVVFQ